MAKHEDINKYLNAVRYVDTWLGDMMKVLDEAGIANETLVVFVGDQYVPPVSVTPHNTNPKKWPGVLRRCASLWYIRERTYQQFSNSTRFPTPAIARTANHCKCNLDVRRPDHYRPTGALGLVE